MSDFHNVDRYFASLNASFRPINIISTKKNNNHKSKHDKILANLFRLNRSVDLLLYLLKLPDEK
ncbi:MAG: hypothetical protein ACO1N7_06700, partial [Sphingobacteriaceae bacterium]